MLKPRYCRILQGMIIFDITIDVKIKLFTYEGYVFFQWHQLT